MGVHAAAVVIPKGLRHEGRCASVLEGDVADDPLVDHHVVGGDDERRELLVDLGLAAGGDFMMVAFDDQPAAPLVKSLAARGESQAGRVTP